MADSVVENAGTLVVSCLNAMAQMPFGQPFLRVLENCLWVIEKTAQWSLPNHEIMAEENGKTFKQMELVRPLPWIFFLPGIIILRILKTSWNIGACVIGYQKVQPSDIVKSVQKARRRLRGIKTNAIKAARQRRSVGGVTSSEENSQLYDVKRNLLRSIQKALSSLSCLDTSKETLSSPITRIQVCSDYEMTPNLDEKPKAEPTITDQKRKFIEVDEDDELSDSVENETLMETIDRLALLEEDDSTFGEESSSESTSSEDVSDVSITELNEITKEAELILASTGASVQNDIGKSFLQTPCNDGDKKINESEIESAEEQNDYYSPFKNSEDGETTFYSPISSKSASPERVIPTLVRDPKDQYVEKHRMQGNGEKSESLNAESADLGNLEKSNGHEKGSKHDQAPQKSIPKGKRSNHGNRKKK